MEREEMKLIQKLKKTQVMQQQAFEDLENALNGDLSHLTQVEEPSPVKRRPATPPLREESKDPEPTPEPEPEEVTEPAAAEADTTSADSTSEQPAAADEATKDTAAEA